MKHHRFLSVVPKAVQRWSLALVCVGGLAGLAFEYWTGAPDAPVHSVLLHAATGLACGVFLGLWLLSLGFVYGDARERGMPAVPWMLLAMLVPNLLGYLLYFVLRKPLAIACPGCGHPIAADQPFCSWCGSSQALPAAPA